MSFNAHGMRCVLRTLGVMEHRLQYQPRTQAQVVGGKIRAESSPPLFPRRRSKSRGCRCSRQGSAPGSRENRIDHVNERAVAARDQEQVRFLGQFRLGRVPARRSIAPVFFSKRSRRFGMTLRKLDAVDSGHPWRPVSTGSPPRRPFSFFCSSHKNSSFPSRPGSGEGITPTVVTGKSLGPRGAVPATTRSRTSASRTIPPLPTSARPASNCGLISAHDPSAGAKQIERRRQDLGAAK